MCKPLDSLAHDNSQRYLILRWERCDGMCANYDVISLLFYVLLVFPITFASHKNCIDLFKLYIYNYYVATAYYTNIYFFVSQFYVFSTHDP